MLHKAVFLDRDGTLVKAFEGRPANKVEELELLPGVLEGLVLLKQHGFRLIVVSNQGGIGLGYLTDATMREMNTWLNSKLDILAQAPVLHDIYWCPHTPDEGCSCRKPKPGLLYAAAYRYKIRLSDSFMIGDDEKDILAGISAGLRFSLRVNERLSFREAVTTICAF